MEGLQHATVAKKLVERHDHLEKQLKQFLNKNLTLIVTGAPGSGKTGLVNRLVAPAEFLSERGLDPKKVTPFFIFSI